MEGIYCSHCKTTEGSFVIQSRGKLRIYYHCLSCNTARARRYYKSGGKLNVYKANLAFASRNKEKHSAWQKIRWALKKGIVEKPNTCSHCGAEKERRLLQGHHRDYTKPLEVLWLCAKCHSEEHKKMLQWG